MTAFRPGKWQTGAVVSCMALSLALAGCGRDLPPVGTPVAQAGQPADSDDANPSAQKDPAVDKSEASQSPDSQAPAPSKPRKAPTPDKPAPDKPAKASPKSKTKAPQAGQTEEAQTDDARPDDARPEDGPGPRERADEAQEPEHPFERHIESPPLDGGLAWINTAGPLSMRDLRGKFVLLDFWTYCCINCIHILPELKKLEQAYPNEIVVIGVHSAKFDGEKDSENIRAAVLRYEIEHPVVNDANQVIWDNFGVQSWPSLRIIDPEGNLVAGHSGEIDFETLDGFFKMALPYYRQKGLLDETPLRFDLEAYQTADTPLRFPGKVLADEAGDRLFIADSNHNRLVVTKLDGTLLDVIGNGQIGADDGDYATASFNKPQGMALRDQTLYVADTENHLLRKIDLAAKQVTTIAGQGHQGRNPWPGLDRARLGAAGEVTLPERFVGEPLQTAINSPWDLLIHGDDLYIAMAGPHQIWKMTLDEKEIGPYAGNGREDIVDGLLLPPQPYEEGFSSFAQPSGLAADDDWLYVADSEGSSIRAVPFDPKAEVKTVVGSAHLRRGRLFAFGDVDGVGEEVLLQHALGVALHEGKLYVADTYNNKIKVVDPIEQSSRTLVGTSESGSADDPPQFDEPAGISSAAGKVYVADTNNHAIRVIDLQSGNRVSTLAIEGLSAPELPAPEIRTTDDRATHVAVDPQIVKAVDGAINLRVALELPEGYKINPLAPMAWTATAEGESGPVDRAALGQPVKLEEPAAEFDAALPVTSATGEDTVRLSLTYYYCQEGSEGLCKVGSVVWTVPLNATADAPESSIPLRLQVE
jgi:DNA-binding beta-propeller fold protein YncE